MFFFFVTQIDCTKEIFVWVTHIKYCKKFDNLGDEIQFFTKKYPIFVIMTISRCKHGRKEENKSKFRSLGTFQCLFDIINWVNHWAWHEGEIFKSHSKMWTFWKCLHCFEVIILPKIVRKKNLTKYVLSLTRFLTQNAIFCVDSVNSMRFDFFLFSLWIWFENPFQWNYNLVIWNIVDSIANMTFISNEFHFDWIWLESPCKLDMWHKWKKKTK